ncbi:acyltransferase [Laspinema sp. A4]|uniref:acyltransferase n=1 Tax=Laspinema sp. D2d TaxID=2953686 RepID=UPI0021BB7E11|nr:acyltransferase [Laspinema sp. D2d]MCT7985260.1 acyltransferase [Laspinema sp. D2d]
MEELKTQGTENNSVQYEIPGLPLTVYRELAAHLRQVQGVEVELIPQTAAVFNYLDSQIAGVSIQYGPDAEPIAPQRVEQILGYYRDRHRRKS